VVFAAFHYALVDTLAILVILDVVLAHMHVVKKWTLVFFIAVAVEVNPVALPTALGKITLIPLRAVHTEFFAAWARHLSIHKNSNKLNNLSKKILVKIFG
jgi:hypothetical protein